MNTAHFHLLLNHFPIIGTLIATGLLAYAFIVKSAALKKAAGAIIVLMALLAIPLPATGEAAEELVEKVPGVSASVIEAHEDMATIAFWIMELTGLAALLYLLFERMKKASAKPVLLVTFFLSILTFAAMARTGYLGGQIRHSEIAGAVPGSQLQDTGDADED